MSLRDQARPSTGTRRRVRLVAVGAAAGTAALALIAGPPAAMAVTVTPVGCSATELTSAVSNASSGDVLSLAPACTYDVTSGLTPSVSLTIDGNGDTITARGSGFTILTVKAGTTVALAGLVLSNASTGTSGGAVANSGALSVTGSVFIGNAAGADGGAIANSSALTVTASVFISNKASDHGGAIANSGTLSVTGSVFNGNTASGTATGDGGGAIFNSGLTATAALTGSAVVANTAGEDGGGILNAGGAVTLSLSPVISNKPDNCAPTGTIAGCTG
jgi:predicted outer membrane repeat protein